MKNWLHNPKDDKESIRISGFIDTNREETNLCAEDLVRAFLARRVLPLQRRAHKISEMSGPMDPTRITTHRLSPTDLVLKAKQICQNPLSSSGRYGLAPYSRRNSPPRRNFRRIGQEHPASYAPDRIFQDDSDADPYVRGEQQMGRTHTPRLATPSANANPQVVERTTPLQAECGAEFLEKLAFEGRKKKAPTPEASSSEIPPAKRSRIEIAEKTVTTKRYRKWEMPVATGRALKITKSASGMRPESSEDRASPRPQPSPKKKNPASSPFKAVSDPSAPASSASAKEAPGAPAPSKAPTPPPAAPTGGPAPAPSLLVLHTSRAAVVAGETVSAQLGRITELTHRGVELGHLADYANKWNQADLSPATRGLGKDKLPVADPAGPRSTVQHFCRLRRVVKEFDTAWHDANNNVVSTLDTWKQLFEELLWEHRELCEAHSKCQAEKERLTKEHQQALDV
nr:actin cytoskeleton-regulatory complex protein PAN1-like [Lolium perenne]